MRGLDPRIQQKRKRRLEIRWIAGSSPAMTNERAPMSEWWTYSLSDFLLFSPRTYYRLFELYNAQIWPAHMLALALGLIALVASGGMRARVVPAILGALWLWVAWAYLLL